MPLYLVKDKELHAKVHPLLLNLQNEIKECLKEGRTETKNPQTLYAKAKKKMIAMV